MAYSKKNNSDRARREKLKQKRADKGRSKKFNKSSDHVKKGLDTGGGRR